MFDVMNASNFRPKMAKTAPHSFRNEVHMTRSRGLERTPVFKMLVLMVLPIFFVPEKVRALNLAATYSGENNEQSSFSTADNNTPTFPTTRNDTSSNNTTSNAHAGPTTTALLSYDDFESAESDVSRLLRLRAEEEAADEKEKSLWHKKTLSFVAQGDDVFSGVPHVQVDVLSDTRTQSHNAVFSDGTEEVIREPEGENSQKKKTARVVFYGPAPTLLQYLTDDGRPENQLRHALIALSDCSHHLASGGVAASSSQTKEAFLAQRSTSVNNAFDDSPVVHVLTQELPGSAFLESHEALFFANPSSKEIPQKTTKEHREALQRAVRGSVFYEEVSKKFVLSLRTTHPAALNFVKTTSGFLAASNYGAVGDKHSERASFPTLNRFHVVFTHIRLVAEALGRKTNYLSETKGAAQYDFFGLRVALAFLRRLSRSAHELSGVPAQEFLITFLAEEFLKSPLAPVSTPQLQAAAEILLFGETVARLATELEFLLEQQSDFGEESLPAPFNSEDVVDDEYRREQDDTDFLLSVIRSEAQLLAEHYGPTRSTTGSGSSSEDPPDNSQRSPGGVASSPGPDFSEPYSFAEVMLSLRAGLCHSFVLFLAHVDLPGDVYDAAQLQHLRNRKIGDATEDRPTKNSGPGFIANPFGSENKARAKARAKTRASSQKKDHQEDAENEDGDREEKEDAEENEEYDDGFFFQEGRRHAKNNAKSASSANTDENGNPEDGSTGPEEKKEQKKEEKKLNKNVQVAADLLWHLKSFYADQLDELSTDEAAEKERFELIAMTESAVDELDKLFTALFRANTKAVQKDLLQLADNLRKRFLKMMKSFFHEDKILARDDLSPIEKEKRRKLGVALLGCKEEADKIKVDLVRRIGGEDTSGSFAEEKAEKEKQRQEDKKDASKKKNRFLRRKRGIDKDLMRHPAFRFVARRASSIHSSHSKKKPEHSAQKTPEEESEDFHWLATSLAEQVVLSSQIMQDYQDYWVSGDMALPQTRIFLLSEAVFDEPEGDVFPASSVVAAVENAPAPTRCSGEPHVDSDALALLPDSSLFSRPVNSLLTGGVDSSVVVTTDAEKALAKGVLAAVPAAEFQVDDKVVLKGFQKGNNVRYNNKLGVVVGKHACGDRGLRCRRCGTRSTADCTRCGSTAKYEVRCLDENGETWSTQLPGINARPENLELLMDRVRDPQPVPPPEGPQEELLPIPAGAGPTYSVPLDEAVGTASPQVASPVAQALVPDSSSSRSVNSFLTEKVDPSVVMTTSTSDQYSEINVVTSSSPGDSGDKEVPLEQWGPPQSYSGDRVPIGGGFESAAYKKAVATSYEWHPEALPEDAMRTPKTVRLKAPYCSRDDGWDHKLTIKSTTAWTPRAHISPKYSQQQNSHDKSQKTKNHGKEEVVDPPLIELFPHFANKRVHANTWLNHEQDPEDEAAKLSHNIDPSSRKEFFRDSFGKGHPDELCSHATWSHSRAGGKFKPLQLKIRGEAAKDDLARARAEELENYKQTLLHKYEWERQSKWKGPGIDDYQDLGWTRKRKKINRNIDPTREALEKLVPSVIHRAKLPLNMLTCRLAPWEEFHKGPRFPDVQTSVQQQLDAAEMVVADTAAMEIPAADTAAADTAAADTAAADMATADTAAVDMAATEIPAVEMAAADTAATEILAVDTAAADTAAAEKALRARRLQFFRDAKVHLGADSESHRWRSFLQSVKRFTYHHQSRDETLREAREIFWSEDLEDRPEDLRLYREFFKVLPKEDPAAADTVAADMAAADNIPELTDVF